MLELDHVEPGFLSLIAGANAALAAPESLYKGQEERFPPPRLNRGCRLRKQPFGWK